MGRICHSLAGRMKVGMPAWTLNQSPLNSHWFPEGKGTVVTHRARRYLPPRDVSAPLCAWAMTLTDLPTKLWLLAILHYRTSLWFTGDVLRLLLWFSSLFSQWKVGAVSIMFYNRTSICNGLLLCRPNNSIFLSSVCGNRVLVCASHVRVSQVQPQRRRPRRRGWAEA